MKIEDLDAINIFEGKGPPWGHKLTPSAFQTLKSILKYTPEAIFKFYYDKEATFENRMSFIKLCHDRRIDLFMQKKIVRLFKDPEWISGIWL